MVSGGPRARSGPAPDPTSARAERRKPLSRLAAYGYQGEAPEYPLPRVIIRSSDGKADRRATSALRKRELEVWAELWRTPQAIAWAVEPWRHRTIALFTRLSVRTESPSSSAAETTAMLRMQEQIGLTPAGLALNGWTIVGDEIAERREEKTPAGEHDAPSPARRGFAVVK